MRKSFIVAVTLAIRCLVVYLCALTYFASEASAQGLSSIPGVFAEIGVGAGAASLGYTGTASQRGAHALGWNPAGINPVDGVELTFSYIDQLESVEYGHVAVAFPVVAGRSALALSAQFSGDDALMEGSLQLAYAHRIRFLWLGVGASFRRAVYGRNSLSASDYVVFDADEIAEGLSRQVRGSANGYSIEAGLTLRLTDDLTYAVSARNISAPLFWKSSSDIRTDVKSYTESVPFELATGIHYELSDRLSGSLEWVPPLARDAGGRIGFGASFAPVDVISFQAGRLILQDGFSNEVSTFGFGIRTPSSMGFRLRADYAYVSSDIARTQQITLTVGL